MKTELLALSMLFAVVGLTACSDDPQGGNTQEPRKIELTPVQSRVASEMAPFGWNYFKAAIDNTAGENSVVSPLSMEFALALTANGTAGTTRSEILAALGFGADDITDMNSYFKTISSDISSLNPDCKLQIANSIWANTDALSFEFLPSFQQTAAEVFAAESRTTNDMNYVADINAWCNKHTSGMIPEFLKKTEKPKTFALINALYFNGKWAHKFDKKDTKPQIFHNEIGDIKATPFMYLSDVRFKYTDREHAQIVELPYKGGTFSMCLIVPHEDSSIDAAITDISDGGWANVLAQMDSTNVRLSMPKFKVEYNHDCRDALSSLGINDLYGLNPDFSPMTATAIGGVQVIQGCVVDVNEDGTEAAAVTLIGGDGTCAAQETAIIKADRPFIYLIQENSTGAILFIGKICKF